MKLKSTAVTVMALFIGLAMIAPLLQAADAGATVPIMRRAEPAVAKPGDVITVFGEALDRSAVADVYLTAAAQQIPVEVIEQTESFIRFRVPAKIEPGKYNPAILMVRESMVLVQPVNLTIQARDASAKPEPAR